MSTKENFEKEHATKMNAEAVEKIKKEVVTQAQSDYVERVFFEDDEQIMLRDGNIYKVHPASLKNARKLMKMLQTIQVDAIILNFVPTEDAQADELREQNFMEVMKMAFLNYPEVTIEYIDEYVDLDTARKIIDVLIGLNGLKK